MAIFYKPNNENIYDTREEAARCTRYLRTLFELAKEHDRFKSNLRWFERASSEKRIWWIDRIEADVAAGKHSTVAADIVVRAISLRLDE